MVRLGLGLRIRIIWDQYSEKCQKHINKKCIGWSTLHNSNCQLHETKHLLKTQVVPYQESALD